MRLQHKVVCLTVTNEELERWLDELPGCGKRLISLNLQTFNFTVAKSRWVAVVAS